MVRDCCENKVLKLYTIMVTIVQSTRLAYYVTP